MPTVSTMKMTARQFLELGEDPVGVRLELVDGEVAVSPSPMPGHSHVEKMLGYLLMQHIISHDLGRLYGDVDTILGEHQVRRPDLIFFSKSRLHLVGEKAIEGPPDLCVEIISPSSIEIDRQDKFDLYQSAGVAFYWVVDPRERSIEAYRLEAGRYVQAGRGQGTATVRLPPFGDLSLPLGRLWHTP